MFDDSVSEGTLMNIYGKYLLNRLRLVN